MRAFALAQRSNSPDLRSRFKLLNGGQSAFRPSIGHNRPDAFGDTVVTASAGAPRERDREGYGLLIERLAAGDQTAMAALYGATSRLVFGLVVRILNDPADAEEVT